MSKLIKLMVACVALGFAFTVSAETATTPAPAQPEAVVKTEVVKAKKAKKVKKAKKAAKKADVKKVDDVKAPAEAPATDAVPPVSN